MTRYCLIGAGAAGISALQKLREAGYNVDCYERDCKKNGVCGSGLVRKETAVSESTTELAGVMIDPVTGEVIDQKELAERLFTQAKEQGVSLVGPGGLLTQPTRNVLETALEAELTEHLGHEHARRRSQPTCATARGPRPC